MGIRRDINTMLMGHSVRALRQCDREMDAWRPADTERALAEVLSFARRHVPFYRNGPERLEDAPVMTRLDVREHFESLKSDKPSGWRTFINRSGGSMGTPAVFLQDDYMRLWGVAADDYFKRVYLGIRPRETRTVVVWGSERDISGAQMDWRKRLKTMLSRTTFLNCFRFNDSILSRHIEEYNRIKPEFLYGFSLGVGEMARFARQKGIVMHRPRALCLTAESIDEDMELLVEEVFGAVAQSYYGAREIGPMAASCRHKRFHVLGFHWAMEIVDDQNRPVGPGEEGRILATTLHNWTMPLIRYDMGDLAVAGDGGPCACGSPAPWFERLAGRVSNYLVAVDGSRIKSGYIKTAFTKADWIHEYHLLQVAVGQVKLYCHKLREPTAAQVGALEESIHRVLGSDCQVEWIWTADIPRTPHGKRLYVRSLVRQDSSRGEAGHGSAA